VYFWYSLIRNKKVGYIHDAVANYRKQFSTLTKNLDRHYQDNIKLFLRLMNEDSDPEIQKFLKKHLGDLYFESSYYYRKNSNKKKAMQYAAQSVLSNPFKFKYYRNFCASILS